MAAELQESYNDTDEITTGKWIDSSSWQAQTFTAGSNYDIESVKLLICWYGSVPSGDLTVSIRATTDAGSGATKPTENDLAVGTVACNTLPEYPSTTFTKITFGSSYSLTSGTVYAICARTGVASPDLYFRGDGASPTYSGGNWAQSTDSGSTWYGWTSIDFMFETWGTATPTAPTEAENPSPADTETDVSRNLSALTWEDGGGATSYNVYYGTVSGSLDQIATGTTELSVSMSAYIPLSFSTIYYWRVDSINAFGPTTGDEWYFYTPISSVTHARYGDYNETLIWDEDAGTWGAADGSGGSHYQVQLVAVGYDDDGNGVVYYGDA